MDDRNEAILWARSILNAPDEYYILDTETTGLTNPEIIELAMIDIQGDMVINQRFKPKGKIEDGASKIHGLTAETLKEEPSFDEVVNLLARHFCDCKILIYNAPFDTNALCCTYDAYGLSLPDLKTECVMQWYSQFCGEWNDYRGSYKWQKLPGGDHSAIGDCCATLDVIKNMARTPISDSSRRLEEPLGLEALPRGIEATSQGQSARVPIRTRQIPSDWLPLDPTAELDTSDRDDDGIPF